MKETPFYPARSSSWISIPTCLLKWRSQQNRIFFSENQQSSDFDPVGFRVQTFIIVSSSFHHRTESIQLTSVQFSFFNPRSGNSFSKIDTTSSAPPRNNTAGQWNLYRVGVSDRSGRCRGGQRASFLGARGPSLGGWRGGSESQWWVFYQSLSARRGAGFGLVGEYQWGFGEWR